MLVNAKLKRADRTTAAILAVAGGGSAMPEQIGEGMYLCRHWNFEEFAHVRVPWLEDPPIFRRFEFDDSGVCDTPEQAVEKLKLREISQQVVVSFVRIRRAEQPWTGGWRWHKWGEYIGDREPQCEYLRHEPDIEEVYTFHVYEPATAPVS